MSPISATRLAGLNPRDRAIFATNARLISCLVTESLLKALYIPIFESEATGIAVLLLGSPDSQLSYEAKDILAIVALSHVPLFHEAVTGRSEK
ncbi:hypothetical protein C0991_012478, partial [Blastosporella zonata]